TAGDMTLTGDVEVLNPALHIATLNSKGRLAMDITVARGRGYVSADRNKTSATIGVIPVDSIFSPVRRVAFTVEPTRVEQSTNYLMAITSFGQKSLDEVIQKLDERGLSLRVKD